MEASPLSEEISQGNVISGVGVTLETLSKSLRNAMFLCTRCTISGIEYQGVLCDLDGGSDKSSSKSTALKRIDLLPSMATGTDSSPSEMKIDCSPSLATGLIDLLPSLAAEID